MRVCAPAKINTPVHVSTDQWYIHIIAAIISINPQNTSMSSLAHIVSTHLSMAFYTLVRIFLSNSESNRIKPLF